MNEQKYGDIVTDFVKGGWNESAFQKFYKAPQTLYNTQIFTPYMQADEGPRAFHVSGEVKPRLWIALYKGKVSPPESGTYHFVGAGDDVLVVRFNGQIVLDGSWNSHGVSASRRSTITVSPMRKAFPSRTNSSKARRFQ